MLTLVALSACKPEPPEIPTFEPTSVGFGFDGAVATDGTLSPFTLDAEPYGASVALHFVSDAYFDAPDDATRGIESCVAITRFELEPTRPALPTEGDAPLFWSYETELVLEASSCSGHADPATWGDDGQKLLQPFFEARFGLGIGPQTEALRSTWDEETLADVGDAMLAMWFAIDDADGDWVAHDWTTGVAYKWDEPTGAVVTTTDLDGNVSLTPLDLAALGTEDPLPPMYLSSTPVVYQALGDLGLEGLAD